MKLCKKIYILTCSFKIKRRGGIIEYRRIGYQKGEGITIILEQILELKQKNWQI